MSGEKCWEDSAQELVRDGAGARTGQHLMCGKGRREELTAERFAWQEGKKTGSQHLKAEQEQGEGGRNGRGVEQGGKPPHMEGAKHRKEARSTMARQRSVPESLAGGIRENSLPKPEGCLS